MITKVVCRYIALALLGLVAMLSTTASAETNAETKDGSTIAAPASVLGEVAAYFGPVNPSIGGLEFLSGLFSAGKESGSDLRSAATVTLGLLEKSNCGTDLSAPPQPTGDALLDRYLLAIDEAINAASPGQMKEAGEIAALSEDVLASWEAEFGSDPRYWQLRSFCTDARAPRESPFATEPPAGELETLEAVLVPLEESRVRGVADWRTLCNIYIQRYVLNRKRENIRLGQKPSFLFPLAKVAEDSLSAELEVINEAIALALEQAWCHYLRANHYFHSGEVELSLADLERGNLASQTEYPWMFPQQEVQNTLASDSVLGSAATMGAVMLVHGRASLTMDLIPRFVAREIVNDTAWSQDRRMFQALHQCCCRCGLSLPVESMGPFQCMLAASLLRLEAEENWELNTDQRETLILMLGPRQVFSEEYFDDELDGAQAAVALGAIAGVRGACVAVYLVWEHGAQNLLSIGPGLLQDLAQVDYNTLATPESLQKYSEVAHARKLELEERARKREAEAAEAAANPLADAPQGE